MWALGSARGEQPKHGKADGGNGEQYWQITVSRSARCLLSLPGVSLWVPLLCG